MMLAAPAARAHGFGNKGVLVPDGRIALSVSRIAPENVDAATIVFFELSPTLLYFVADRIAIGGKVEVSAFSGGGVSDSSFGIGAIFAYALPLGARATWLPGGGMTLRPSGDGTTLVFEIDAPILVHFDNFFIGAGPFLDVDIVDPGVHTTLFGFGTRLGGHIDLAGGGSMDAAPPPPSRKKKEEDTEQRYDM